MSTRITRLIVVCSVLVVVGLVGTTGSRQELPVSTGSSVTPFRERVAGYSRLRQQLITHLLARGVDPNAGHGVEFRNQLGLAIREARRAAQPGEISARMWPVQCGNWCGRPFAARTRSWPMCPPSQASA